MPDRRRDPGPPHESDEAPLPQPDLGQPRLRPQDTHLGRTRAGAHQHGRGVTPHGAAPAHLGGRSHSAPRLLKVDCKTIPHMRLATALCRYVELADVPVAGLKGRKDLVVRPRHRWTADCVQIRGACRDLRSPAAPLSQQSSVTRKTLLSPPALRSGVRRERARTLLGHRSRRSASAAVCSAG